MNRGRAVTSAPRSRAEEGGREGDRENRKGDESAGRRRGGEAEPEGTVEGGGIDGGLGKAGGRISAPRRADDGKTVASSTAGTRRGRDQWSRSRERGGWIGFGASGRAPPARRRCGQRRLQRKRASKGEG